MVQDRALKFAKQNAEMCFSLASELANAKDLTDVMGIQARHAQTLMQTYAPQAPGAEPSDDVGVSEYGAEKAEIGMTQRR